MTGLIEGPALKLTPMDVSTFLRQQQEAATSELRNIGSGSDLTARALRSPFEARAAILAWLTENRVTDEESLVRTLDAVIGEREVVPSVAPRVGANEAGYLLRRWRWFNPPTA